MKIFYDDNTGKIYYAIADKDLFWFKHTTHIPLTEMEIDELAPVNQDLCIDLRRNVSPSGRVDSEGDEKYKIVDGVLNEKAGWMEVEDEL